MSPWKIRIDCCGRIHEFNVQPIVSVFLPYHETPHFLKMVSILHIPCV